MTFIHAVLFSTIAFTITACSSPVVRKITSSEAVQNKVLQLCQYQSALGSIEMLLSIMYPAVNSVIEEGQSEATAGLICDAVARAKRDKKAIAFPSIKIKIEVETGESKVIPIEGKIVAPLENKPIDIKVDKVIEPEKPKE